MQYKVIIPTIRHLISIVMSSSYPWFRFSNYIMSIPFLKLSSSKNSVETLEKVSIFDFWWLFSAVGFFSRSTNANWRGWPRSVRSCVRVWTIFREDSTTPQNDSSVHLLTRPSCYWNNISVGYFISDIAIYASVLLFWRCEFTCGSHCVFNRLYVIMAFINRNLFVLRLWAHLFVLYVISTL